MMRFLKWLFHSLTPYLVGVLLGIGFFILLARFIGSPGKLLQSAPDLSQHVAWLSGVMNGKVASDTSEVKVETVRIAPKQGIPEDATVAQSHASSEISPHQETTTPTPAVSLPQPASPLPLSGQKYTPVQTHSSGDHRGDGVDATHGPTMIIIEECGLPPMRPGLDQERYMACQWRRNCQIRVDNYQKMIAQGLQGCPKNTTHAQMCRNFYRSLEMQNPPQACDGPPWYGVSQRN
ncbi:MAG: hypothetical protein H7829_09395 [Magnetococcus sp. THC-1_WYH]